jgi:hypothetical protein
MACTDETIRNHYVKEQEVRSDKSAPKRRRGGKPVQTTNKAPLCSKTRPPANAQRLKSTCHVAWLRQTQPPVPSLITPLISARKKMQLILTQATARLKKTSELRLSGRRIEVLEGVFQNDRIRLTPFLFSEVRGKLSEHD